MYRNSHSLRLPNCVGVLRSRKDTLTLFSRIPPSQLLGRRSVNDEAPNRTRRRIHVYYAVPAKPKAFVVEHVDGRERHLSWSSERGLVKMWKEIDRPSEDEDVSEEPPGKIASAVSSLSGRISSWFRQMFLPTNYPQSVHRS